MHKVFNLPNQKGITAFLSGIIDDYSNIVHKTDIENLNIITAGVIPPNPSELIGSERMKKFISLVKTEWDIIIFDSPPLIAVTDAAIISKFIDKMLVVVMPNQTNKKALYYCLEILANIESPLEGIIFNGVDSRSSYGSYYYQYQYYEYYGKDKSD